MIFVQNKTDNTRVRLGVALGASENPIKEKQKKAERLETKITPTIKNVFKEENKEEEPKKIINQKKEEEDKEKISSQNIFQIKRNPSLGKNKKKKNYVVKLKNNMIFPINVPGCTPYDPYLINVCKKAIINVKDELPNYKEIIKKINTEFGIEEGNNLIELNSDNIGYKLKTLNTFSNTNTKTNYTKNKITTTNTAMNTVSNFNKVNTEEKEEEKEKDIDKDKEIFIRKTGKKR